MKQKNIISCKVAAKLMCQSFDRKLTAREQMQLKAHLAICKTCVYCYKQVRTLRKVYSQYAQIITQLTPPAECCLSQPSKQKMKALLLEAI